MLALDTNVILRYLVRDDEAQAEAANSLLESLTAERPGFICREVIIELVWILERAYRFTRSQIADLMNLSAYARVGAGPLYTIDRALGRAEGAALVEPAPPAP